MEDRSNPAKVATSPAYLADHQARRTAFSAGFLDDLAKTWRDKGRQTMEWTADNQVREVRLSAGAEFVVAICGEIMTMPGLPKRR